jgi:predicted nucleotidyltransferase
MHFDITKYTIFKTVFGSHAYGLATPESDIDYRGVCVPPRALVLSPFQNFEQYQSEDQPDDPEDDTVIYSILKFVRLACEANPSLLELFYIDERHYVYSTTWWERLREHRDLFLSTRVIASFTGYAAAQLKRMRNHARWMENPPTEPKPEDFNLTHAMLLGKDEIGAYDWLNEQEVMRFSKDVVSFMSRVKFYKNALKQWKAYENWRKNRNPGRAKLEREHGYDSKHAYHIVRLARLGEELLLTGKMTVTDRPDKDELAAVRRGEWSYDRILEFASAIDGRMVELENDTVLPNKPDREQIDLLTQEIVEDFWRRKSEQLS